MSDGTVGAAARSARDDYPACATLAEACAANASLKKPEAVRMLEEIDHLRALRVPAVDRVIEAAKAVVVAYGWQVWRDGPAPDLGGTIKRLGDALREVGQ